MWWEGGGGDLGGKVSNQIFYLSLTKQVMIIWLCRITGDRWIISLRVFSLNIFLFR